MKSITDKLSLRDSTCWDGFRETAWIPHRYGICAGSMIQYSADRRTFVFADHPCLAVDDVLVSGLPVTNWVMRNDLDSTGRAICFVDFTEPVDEGKEVIGRGRGKLQATRGGLINNCADVLHDMLVNVHGLLVPEARLSAFRAESAGLPVGGSLESGDVTAIAAAREICDSIGAVFAPDMRGLARLFPGNAAAIDSVTRLHSATCESDRASVINDLTIRYAHDAGNPRGSCQFLADDSITRFGRQSVVLDAPWIRDVRTAAAVAVRRLEFSARAHWVADVSGITGQIKIGQSVSVDHPVLPFTGTYMITAREYNSSTDKSNIIIRATVGATPRTRLLRNSIAFDANSPSQPSVTIADDVFEITVVDENNVPLPGAQCTLDSQVTRNADSSGTVSFPIRYATPGQHTIVAVAQDGRPPVTIVITI